MKVYAPNKQYTGISAGVPFVNGEADVPPEKAEWFRTHGYIVGKDENTAVKSKK